MRPVAHLVALTLLVYFAAAVAASSRRQTDSSKTAAGGKSVVSILKAKLQERQASKLLDSSNEGEDVNQLIQRHLKESFCRTFVNFMPKRLLRFCKFFAPPPFEQC